MNIQEMKSLIQVARDQEEKSVSLPVEESTGVEEASPIKGKKVYKIFRTMRKSTRKTGAHFKHRQNPEMWKRAKKAARRDQEEGIDPQRKLSPSTRKSLAGIAKSFRSFKNQGKKGNPAARSMMKKAAKPDTGKGFGHATVFEAGNRWVESRAERRSFLKRKKKSIDWMMGARQELWQKVKFGKGAHRGAAARALKAAGKHRRSASKDWTYNSLIRKGGIRTHKGLLKKAKVARTVASKREDGAYYNKVSEAEFLAAFA